MILRVRSQPEEIVDILIDSHRRMLTTLPRHDVSRGVCRVSPSA
jgi:hypothetical protein